MSQALYRRYRPETFAEVIGQEHVTGPLTVALTKDRINHAYLFSGPRGCGKTTSARILARCLNCAQGPTATPCGECESCRDLARGGPGSLDVVEIDAASHGGVDDARSLRERAAFAPARDRFKVFIIDEAHMVSTQGFNALLKIVEEPPPHVRFVFATTEPDKVIGTIRSRTHHYPFRLVPPERLQAYLAQLCEQEDVAVGQGVLPLVVRAGGGSVRDSLSVLDQLIGGAGPDGLTYPLAVSLLGYTDATMLDDVVDALAAGDGGTVFGVVDRVVESGHDPRRFVEDLLERLRDLVVVVAVPDGGHAVLRALPSDQLDRMRGQAARFGRAELSRAADVVNAALTEMTGATSPRLQLELLCARLLLPAADDAQRGLHARLDRLERRVGVAGAGGAPPLVSSSAASSAAPPPSTLRATPTARPGNAGPPTPLSPAPTPSGPASPGPAPSAPGSASAEGVRRVKEPGAGATAAAVEESAGAPTGWVAGADRAGPGTRSGPPAEQPVRQQAGGAPAGRGAPRPGSAAGRTLAGGTSDLDIATIRRMWPEAMASLASRKRTTWSLISQYAQVLDFDGERLLLGFDSEGRSGLFAKGPHAEVLRQVLIDVLGLDCRFETVVGGRAPMPGGNRPASGSAVPVRGHGGPGAAPGGPGVPAGGPGVPAGGPGVPAGGPGVPAGGPGAAAGGPGVPAGGPGAAPGRSGAGPDGSGAGAVHPGAGGAVSGRAAVQDDGWPTPARPPAGGRPATGDVSAVPGPEHGGSTPGRFKAQDGRPWAGPGGPEGSGGSGGPGASGPGGQGTAPGSPGDPDSRPGQGRGSQGSRGQGRGGRADQRRGSDRFRGRPGGGGRGGGREMVSPYADVPPPDEPLPDDEPPYEDGPPPDAWGPTSASRSIPSAAVGPAGAHGAGSGVVPGGSAGAEEVDVREIRPTVPVPSGGSAAPTEPQRGHQRLAAAAAATGSPGVSRPFRPLLRPIDDVPSADDPDIEGSNLVGAAVVEQILGGRLIEERED